MKYIIDFEDEPCCDKPKLYRMKHTYTVCVPRETLEKFPRYEEGSEKDAQRLKELENLKEGDVVIAVNDVGVIRRMGLVIFVYTGEENPYEIVTNYGAITRRNAKNLFSLGYEKSIIAFTTEEFFSKCNSKPDGEVNDEAAEELSNLQPGDVIYKYVGEEKLQRRMVNFVYTCPAGYELINESGWKGRYSLESLINQGWRKVKGDLTTKDFYWKLRGGAY